MVGSLVAVCRLEGRLNLQVAAFMLALAGLAPAPAFVAGLAAYMLLPYAVLSFALADRACFSVVNRLDISYGIYLFSFLIQQALVQACIYRHLVVHVGALTVLSALLSAMAGLATERLIERPALRLQGRVLHT